MKRTRARASLKRIGGNLSQRFAVYRGELLLGETHITPDGWAAYAAGLGGELTRLPGTFPSAQDARNHLVEINEPGDSDEG